jgi:hypothetical protein
MPRTVLILGAGASVSEAIHFRPKRTQKHPPLDNNFFRKVEKDASSLIDPVAKEAAEVGQANLFRNDPPVSLEQHLGRLFFAVRNESTERTRAAYFNLVRLYHSELLSTTNWMIGRTGKLRKLIQGELGAGNTLAILTFNHDLLVENALDLLPKQRKYAGCWCMTHAYGLDGLSMISSEDEAFESECPGCDDKLVRLLKLHGSLNWVFRTVNRDPPPGVLSPPTRRTKKRELFLWTNKRLPSRPGIKLRTQKGHRDWYLWPLIVPPIYEKHGMLRGELEEVWRQAADEVGSADKAIFWGYSFPRADLHARYFFDRAANENDALREPIMVNPDPQAVVSLWETLRPKSIRHYRHIGDCLRGEYSEKPMNHS